MIKQENQVTQSLNVGVEVNEETKHIDVTMTVDGESLADTMIEAYQDLMPVADKLAEMTGRDTNILRFSAGVTALMNAFGVSKEVQENTADLFAEKAKALGIDDGGFKDEEGEEEVEVEGQINITVISSKNEKE